MKEESKQQFICPRALNGSCRIVCMSNSNIPHKLNNGCSTHNNHCPACVPYTEQPEREVKCKNPECVDGAIPTMPDGEPDICPDCKGTGKQPEKKEVVALMEDDPHTHNNPEYEVKQPAKEGERLQEKYKALDNPDWKPAKGVEEILKDLLDAHSFQNVQLSATCITGKEYEEVMKKEINKRIQQLRQFYYNEVEKKFYDCLGKFEHKEWAEIKYIFSQLKEKS